MSGVKVGERGAGRTPVSWPAANDSGGCRRAGSETDAGVVAGGQRVRRMPARGRRAGSETDAGVTARERGARQMNANRRERAARRAMAIAAATATASFLVIGPASAAPASAPRSAAAAAAAAATKPRTLTLINGDRVAVSATRSGGVIARVARAAASGIGGAMVRLDLA